MTSFVCLPCIYLYSRDDDGLVRLELQQAIHVGLAPKLEVGRHELAGNAAPVVGGVGGI